MTDHEPHASDREQLRLEEAREAERIAQAKTKAFQRWHEYLAKKVQLSNALESSERESA